MLDEDMQRVVAEQRLGYVASVCPDGTANLSPKGTVSVWDERHLVFAHIHSHQTVANIEAGNVVVEVNVVDPIRRKGYRFKGPAEVHREGKLYQAGAEFFERRSGLDEGRIQAIVLIRVKRAAALLSPAYDDGSTEHEIEQRFLAVYRLQRAEPMPLARLVDGDSRRRRFGLLLGRLVELPIVGAWLARAARAPLAVKPLSTRVTRLHAVLLRRARGRLRRSWLFAAGQPVIALTTVGRRSGIPRTTAVACFTDRDELVVAGMNLGMPRDPAWALNLADNPQATIELAGQEIFVTAERATGEHAARLWQRWSALQPSAPAFRELAGREIPLFVLKRRA